MDGPGASNITSSCTLVLYCIKGLTLGSQELLPISRSESPGQVFRLSGLFMHPLAPKAVYNKACGLEDLK